MDATIVDPDSKTYVEAPTRDFENVVAWPSTVVPNVLITNSLSTIQLMMEHCLKVRCSVVNQD